MRRCALLLVATEALFASDIGRAVTPPCDLGEQRPCKLPDGNCGAEICDPGEPSVCCSEYPECGDGGPDDPFITPCYYYEQPSGTAVCAWCGADGTTGECSYGACYNQQAPWTACTETPDPPACDCDDGAVASCSPDPGYLPDGCGRQTCSGGVYGACTPTRECDDTNNGPGGTNDQDGRGGGGGGGGPLNGMSGGDNRSNASDADSDNEACTQAGDPVDVRTGVTTFFPHRKDALLQTEVGPLDFGRFYSTASARLDYAQIYYSHQNLNAPVRSAVLKKGNDGLGIGWRHGYSYSLQPVIDALGVRQGVLFVAPDGASEMFPLPNNSSIGDVKLPNGDSFKAALGANDWVVTTADHSRFYFQINGTTVGNVFTSTLLELYTPAHKHIAFTYGGINSAMCDQSYPAPDGKLCVISDDFNNSIVLGYRPSGEVQRLTISHNGQFVGTSFFNYYSEPVLRSDGSQFFGETVSLPTYVEYRDTSGNYVDREFYAYRLSSYLRVDLGSAGGYQTSSPIVFPFGLRGVLLTIVQDSDLRFITRHEYTAEGLTAAAIAPGEYLRFRYQEISPDELRVAFFNESAGTQGEYRIVNNMIAEVTSAQLPGCNLAPAQFVRDTNGSTTVKLAEPASVGGPQVRSTYAYNTAGQVTLSQENWSGSPNALATTVDDPATPVRVKRYAYLSDAVRLKSESRVYSVTCARASEFGLPCNNALSAVEPLVEYDYDSDYDDDFNENPGTKMKQVRRSGLSASESSDAVVSQTRLTRINYDSPDFGRVVSIQTTDGTNPLRLITFTYHGGYDTPNYGHLATVTRGNYSSTLVEERGDYNQFGYPGLIRDPRAASQRTFAYNTNGKLTAQIDSDGTLQRSLTYVYWANSILRWVDEGASGVEATRREYQFNNDSAGGPSAFAYEFCNSLLSSWDPAGCLTNLGRLVTPSYEWRTYSGEYPRSRTFGLDARGNVISSRFVFDNSATKRYASAVFDEHDKLVRRFKYTNNQSAAAYVEDVYRDTQGRIIAKAEGRFANVADSHADNADNANFHYSYDALGRLVQISQGPASVTPRVTSYRYDGADNLIASTDPNGRVTSYLYNDFGELIAVSSPDSGLTKYRYNALGQLVRAVYADVRVTTYAYDELGRATQREDSKGTSTLARTMYYDSLDAAGLSLPAICSTNDNVFDVDEDQLPGKLAWISEDWGRRYFSYNTFGEIVAVYDQPGSVFDACALSITRYSYNAHGDQTSIRYPSGLRVRYDVRGDGLSSQVNIRLSDSGSERKFAGVVRDEDGPVTRLEFEGWGQDMKMYDDRDLSGQLVQRNYWYSSNKFFWSTDVNLDGVVDATERDGNGNILKVKDHVSGDGIYATMNDFDELVAWRHPGQLVDECAYAYDGGGNRLSEICSDHTASYTYVTGSSTLDHTTWSALPSTCSASLPAIVSASADAVGNVASYAKDGCPGDLHTIDYDAANRVASFDANPSTAITYDEQHLARTIGARKLVYDLKGHLLSDRAGSVGVDYVWVDDLPIAVVQPELAGYNEAVMILGTDHLNAPTRAFQSGNAAAWSVSYEPFGSVSPNDGATSYSPTPAIALRRPGQIANAQSGLLANEWRSYEPHRGAYTQVDPLTRSGAALSSYRYALSNPLAVIDSTGLIFEFVDSFSARVVGDLASNPAFAGMIDALERAPDKIYVHNNEVESGLGGGYSYGPGVYDSKYGGTGNWSTNTDAHIFWDADVAAASGVTGDPSSPWAVVAHELAHAYDRIVDENNQYRFEDNALKAENSVRLQDGQSDRLDRACTE